MRRASRGRLATAALLAALAAGTAPAIGGDAATEPADGLGAAIERGLRPLVERGDFSGCAGIRKQRGAAVVRCVGFADAERRIPNTPDTRFLIGSVSKQFTAAAVLRLQEMGRLTTDDPLARFVPDFPRGDRITLRHLLSHTSGMPDLYGLPDFERRSLVATSTGDWVALFAAQPPLFEPGADFAYSNSGYVTLAHVIETVSGTSYGAFLSRELLRPLGLDGTGDSWPEIPAPAAVGYDPSGPRGRAPAPYRHPTDSTGAGTVYSTIDDLLVWGPALVTGGVLGESATTELLTRGSGGYGYGVGLFKRHGRWMAGHDGRLPGFIAALDVFLDDGTAIAFVSNVQSGAADELREALTALAVGAPVEPTTREPLAPVAVPAAELARLAGRYRFSPSLVVEVRLSGERLMARANNSAFTELAPLGGGRFFSRATYATAAFEGDGEGRIARMLWSVGASSFPGARIDDGSD